MSAPSPPSLSILGTDPSRKCVLNGNAFQQDAIRSFNGWQYACFYSPLSSDVCDSQTNRLKREETQPVFVHLARRKLQPSPGSWETIIFHDYAQTTDDGHNTVQLGICPGDGTIHLSYDHHCDRIRYRHSTANLAHQPETYEWTTSLFTPTLPYLPGLEHLSSSSSSPTSSSSYSSQPSSNQENPSNTNTTSLLLLDNITYPRFGPLGSSSLFFSFRTGKAGSGDDWICVYSSSSSPDYHHHHHPQSSTSYKYHILGSSSSSSSPTTPPTPWIQGLTPSPETRCNPYLNSLTYHQLPSSSPTTTDTDGGGRGVGGRRGRLYATWVWRGWVHYPGWDDPSDTKHKRQAGPNGGEENRDICFAFSDRTGAGAEEEAGGSSSSDDFTIWYGDGGGGKEKVAVVADLSKGESISSISRSQEEEEKDATITAYSIPRDSGLANQESQAVDSRGGLHVLNRDDHDYDGGKKNKKNVRWKHYYRRPEGGGGGGCWIRPPRTLPMMRNITPTKRGQLATTGSRSGGEVSHGEEEEEDDDLYFVLPGNGNDDDDDGDEGEEGSASAAILTILKATRGKGYEDYTVFWRGNEVGGRRLVSTEPLVDAGRLSGHDSVLSVFTRVEEVGGGGVEVAVLDFALG